MEESVQHHAAVALPPGIIRYPSYKGAGWARGPVSTGAKNLATTGIRSLCDPIASRYTDYAIPAQNEFGGAIITEVQDRMNHHRCMGKNCLKGTY
jgi:hypothetical protein